METWYRISKWDSSIKAVKVVKHTERLITLAASESCWGEKEQRVAKGEEYFPTFDEARTELLNSFSRKLNSATQDAARYKKQYDIVFMKDKPDPK